MSSFIEHDSNKEKQNRRDAKKKEIVKNNIILNANKVFRKILDIAPLPSSMVYFINLLKRNFVDMEDIERNSDQKTFGIYCVMIPEEIIYSAGAIPLKLCGGSHMAAAMGDEIIPRDACPLVKAVIGATKMKLFPATDNCHSFIVPTSCDCKRKMVGTLENLKEVYPIHLPSVRDKDDYKEYFLEELYDLVKYIEKSTGNKITREGLYNWIVTISKAQKEIFRLYSFQKNKPSIIKGSHVISVLNSYSFDTVERWTRSLKVLNDELEERVKNKNYVSKDKNPRIMIIGAPIIFPNIKIPLLIEESGGIVVIDETCAGSRWMYDPVAIGDKSFNGLMRAIANRYMLPCTCPTFVINEQRIFKLEQMIEDFKVEGVVYHILRGCLPYDFEFGFIEEAMNKLDIPIIKVETDYNEEDMEQLRIRFEAFVELIQHKNKK